MTALMLIPAYTPPLPDDAHLTLVWPGNDKDVPPQVHARLHAMVPMFAQQNQAFAAKVMGTGMFGTNHNEPVLLVELTSQLAMMRAAVVQFSQSEHSEFRPHVAVPRLGLLLQRGPLTRAAKLPKVLYFNAISYWPAEDGDRGATTAWLGG